MNRKREERFIFIFVWRALNENGSRRLCSFALLLFISLPKWCCSCRYKRRDTTRDRIYEHRDALRLYIAYATLLFPSPYPLLFFFFSFPSFFSKTRLETFARETLKPTATDAMFRGPPINKKTFSRVHFSTLPRVTSKKFRPVKKETGMRSYLDTGLVNIRHVAKGKGTSRACTHVRRDC